MILLYSHSLQPQRPPKTQKPPIRSNLAHGPRTKGTKIGAIYKFIFTWRETSVVSIRIKINSKGEIGEGETIGVIEEIIVESQKMLDKICRATLFYFLFRNREFARRVITPPPALYIWVYALA